MSQALNDSLAKITRGTGLVLVGILAARFLFFIVRVLVARYGAEADIMKLPSYLSLDW